MKTILFLLAALAIASIMLAISPIENTVVFVTGFVMFFGCMFAAALSLPVGALWGK